MGHHSSRVNYKTGKEHQLEKYFQNITDQDKKPSSVSTLDSIYRPKNRQ